MRTINVSAVSASGFDPDFDDVKTIELDDKPFAEGGFGRIYNCRSINGKPFNNPQVIKVFKDNHGSAAHSYKTIMGLQAGLVKKRKELAELGIDFMEYYPAFFGAPQFVFEGELDGAKVQGYSANNLKHFGYVCFTDVIEQTDLLDHYDSTIDYPNRYAKAYHLMRAFTLLNEIRYIHADFKADNFFVSLGNDGRCALIDFDSGAIINQLEDETFTVGTPSQDMLAPEIRRELSETGRATVNLLTDIWSVAVASHYLLFIMHPFSMLTEVSDNSVQAYNEKYVWPDLDKSFPYYNEANESLIEFHKKACSILPKDLIECFKVTFAKGYFNPHYRTSYNQWCMKLRPHIPESEARPELSKIRYDIDKKKRLEEERKRKEQEEKDRISRMRVKPDEYPYYISGLVMSLIRKETFINSHKEELEEVGQQLNMPELEKKLMAFLVAYYDIWADGIITDIERRKFQFLGKCLKMPEDTVDYLLNCKP